MRAHVIALITLLVVGMLGCKREVEPDRVVATQVVAAPPAPTPAADAAVPDRTPTWYRAVLRAPDGVEVPFFLGVPPPGAPGLAAFKVGDHEVRSDATFDRTTLKIPMTVHQTALEATKGTDGILRGTFSTAWRAWGASSIPLTATQVIAPTARTLATVTAGAVLDLGAPRTTWRLAMSESGVAKLVVDQIAPGDFEARMFLDTGNIIYLAGNGRGDTIVLGGFDGTSGYRIELTLGSDRKRARGKWFAGHHLDWRESVTATRGAEFDLAVKAKATRPGVKISLPDLPALAALPPGPLVVELAGSWCSTCRNAAPFLVELHRAYQSRGLQMVTLLYELTDDPVVDAAQAATFKQTYGVTWPVVPVQGTVEDLADILPSNLADINPAGFPITLFLAADRSLVALHAGFPAPAATEDFARVAAEFRARIETLLAAPRAPRPR
ncbi:MAG: TlpA family protein disulfide reductase [Deltaproteobacteria bacterium]|nr:TlpA family protein disulfide reductase [Deltaproteobacteria bacterium]